MGFYINTISYVAWMKRSGIRGGLIFPDFASLHPGYIDI